jgi:hypothetical protein
MTPFLREASSWQPLIAQLDRRIGNTCNSKYTLSGLHGVPVEIPVVSPPGPLTSGKVGSCLHPVNAKVVERINTINKAGKAGNGVEEFIIRPFVASKIRQVNAAVQITYTEREKTDTETANTITGSVIVYTCTDLFNLRGPRQNAIFDT